MKDQEKRNISRVPFKTSATLKKKDFQLQGGIKDLSLKGVFIITTEKLDEGTDVEVDINLSGSTTDISLKLHGSILRSSQDGLAVKFVNIDLDSYIFLKNIVTYSDEHIIDFQH